jgi:hypothetical protein
MQVFGRSGDISQIDNIIALCSASTSRVIVSIPFQPSPSSGPRWIHFDEIHQNPMGDQAIGNRPVNDSTLIRYPTHIGRDRYPKVDEQDCEGAEMIAGRRELGQQTGEIESVGRDLALRSFVTKNVTNSDGEPRGTEGNCHQF